MALVQQCVGFSFTSECNQITLFRIYSQYLYYSNMLGTDVLMLPSITLPKCRNSACLTHIYQQTDPYTPSAVCLWISLTKFTVQLTPMGHHKMTVDWYMCKSNHRIYRMEYRDITSFAVFCLLIFPELHCHARVTVLMFLEVYLLAV